LTAILEGRYITTYKTSSDPFTTQTYAELTQTVAEWRGWVRIFCPCGGKGGDCFGRPKGLARGENPEAPVTMS